MAKKNAWVLVLVSLFLACGKDPTGPGDEPTFDEKLYALPDITVTEISPQNGYPRQFEIYISQPLDHSNPDGTTFMQQIFLSHRDEVMMLMPLWQKSRRYHLRLKTRAMRSS